MKFSKAWVEEWVKTGMTAGELSDVITMAGLEVDTVEKAAGDFDHVVVGRVVECADHPDSDHLHVTKVDVGGSELLDIVCGAPNCRKDLKVCVAMIGAVLPGDFKIKPAKLRGVASNGMLCSYRELGVDIPSEGIIELPDDAPLGEDVRTYFGWDDELIEVDLTANRADCLSIIGLAREIAVLTGKEYTLPDFTRAVPSLSDTVSITLDDPKACPRYFGRVFKGLNVRAETPLWMKEKLRRCGLRSVDPIVDVTNYVMLELGQPLHSFDLNKLQGGIHVRFARPGEKLKVLSGEELELRPSTLVIADDTGPVAMAGIYGGLDTGVSENTTDILLECAYFSPDAVKGEAREYGLATDASHRNERGIDWNIQELACERATQLLLDICGGSCGEIIRAEAADSIPVSKKISLDMALVHRVIGENIVTEEQVLKILNGLGIRTESLGGGRMVSNSPSWRIDIAIAEDLIEEVARIHGYNNIPNAAPKAELNMLRSSMTDLPLDRLKSQLVCRNYNEVVTYSFVDQQKMAAMYPDMKPIVIPKPITADMDAMRVSLLPGLMQVIAFNNARQVTSLKIFESGLKFISDDSAPNGIAQIKTLAGAISGLADSEQWSVASRNVDFFDIKGDLEALLELTGEKDRYTFVPLNSSALHPGQSAAVMYDGRQVGVVGQIHPAVQKKYGVKFKTFVFEIELDALSRTQVPVYHEISKFPSNRRDIAIVVDDSVPAGEIIDTIKKASSDLIRSVSLFDLYSGGTMESGKKSIAISMQLQDLNSTLDEARISETVSSVLGVLKDRFNAVLRE
jgi:phenylalanyl-tRNA synthetase beta chain